jgi:protein-L-isoaspartate(D-aspartate) O-methyltransferase
MKEIPEERYTVLRHRMVQRQIRNRGVRDERLLGAMEDVPRHLFVGEAYRGDAYSDTPLPIGRGQTISQPYMVAAMTECLALQGSEVVLEVGTGSGYQAAILAKLARKVYTVERIPRLASRAREVLGQVGATNVVALEGDGSVGLAEHAPYDAILIAAGVRRIPEAILPQLADGGRLAVPVGGRDHQVLVLVRRSGDDFQESRLTPCVFVPLIGQGGWEEDSP